MNSHYQFMPKDAPSWPIARSYSYRIDMQDGSVFFTGDTGPSKNLADCAKGVDVLVSEVIDLDAAVAFASRFFDFDEERLKKTAEHMAMQHIVPTEIGKLAQAA